MYEIYGNRQVLSAMRWLMLWALMMFSGYAGAYSYGPASQAEWNGWPEQCKVRYTVSGEGRASAYAGMYPAGTIALWESRYGECWRYLHHHCAGLLQLQRAKAARSKSDRNFALQSAVKEHNFALTACPISNPESAAMLTHLGMAYLEAGDTLNSRQSLDKAISAHPEYGGAYIATAMLLRKTGKRTEALDVLVKGSEATDGGSAELENALGHAYFDNKQYEKAREHARKAYSLGYPLPGLRDKLTKAGYPL